MWQNNGVFGYCRQIDFGDFYSNPLPPPHQRLPDFKTKTKTKTKTFI